MFGEKEVVIIKKSDQTAKGTDDGRKIYGKPLLIRGEPGTGRTMLVQAAEVLGKQENAGQLSALLQAAEKVRRTFSAAFTMSRFFAEEASFFPEFAV